MGSRFPAAFTNTSIGVLPASAVETLMLTIPNVSPAYDNQPILVEGFLNIQAGTGVTGITTTIRRGSLVTSPTVGSPSTHSLSAGQFAAIKISVIDILTLLAAAAYSLTVIQTGATVASGLNTISMWALAL